MNLYKIDFQKRPPLRHKVQDFIFKYFPTQSKNRGRIETVLVYLNTISIYIILFLVITQLLGRQFLPQGLTFQQRSQIAKQQSNQHNQPQQQGGRGGYRRGQIQQEVIEFTIQKNYLIMLILFSARLTSILLFLFIQKTLLMFANKGLVISSIVMSAFFVNYSEDKMDNYTPFTVIKWITLIIELSGLGVWAFKKQNRIKPGLFDSRLSSFLGYAKEASVYLLVFFASQIVMYYNDNTSKIESDPTGLIMVNISIRELHVAVYVVIALAVCLYCDCFDLMYNSTFKILNVSFDSALIFLFVSQMYLLQFYHVPFPKQGTATGTGQTVSFLLFFLLLSLLLTFNMLRESDQQIDLSLLFETQFCYIQYKSQAQIIQYFEELRKLCSLVTGQGCRSSQGRQIYAIMLVNYIELHRKQCCYLDCPITARYSAQKSIKQKTQILLEMIVISLKELSVIRPDVKRYLVYYLSPEDRVFKFLDEDVLYMRRERFRINQGVREVSNEIIMLEAQANKRRIVNLIQRYITVTNQFFQGLLSQKINAQTTFSKGFEMLQALKKIEETKNQAENFTQQVRTLLNNFTSRMIKTPDSKILDTVIDPPFLLKKTTDSGPIFIISAERYNITSLIDVNTSCTKEFYYTRKELLSLTVIDLLPPKIRQPHQIIFKKVAKRTNFNGRRDDLTFTIFIQNKLGYASLSTAIIYMINSIKGRMWCVSLTVRHKMDSILIVQDKDDGVLMHMTQMTVFHGLTLVHKKLELAQSILSRLKSTRSNDGTSYRQVLILANQPFFKGNSFRFSEDKIMQITEKIEAFNMTYVLIKINSKVVVESERTRDKNQIKKMMRNSEFGQSLENNITKLKTFNESQFEEGLQIPLRQFYYHSDGVIRNYEQDSERVKQRFLVDDFPTDKRHNAEKIYGSEITEMRLCKGNVLDFIQNMEVEDQFQAKPQPAQVDMESLNRFKMTSQIFEESLFVQRKKSAASEVLKSRIFYSIITLLFISLTLTLYFLSSKYSNSVDSQHISLNALASNIDSYSNVVKLIIFTKYYDPIKMRARALPFRISNFQNALRYNLQIMFEEDRSIQVLLDQDQISSALEKFMIQINEIKAIMTPQFQKIHQYDERPILSSYVDTAFPLLNQILQKKHKQYAQRNVTGKKKLFLLIGLQVLLVAVIISWTVVIEFLLLRRQKHLGQIFGQINDDILEKQLIKLKMFQEFLYFNKDIFSNDDLAHRITTLHQTKSSQIQKSCLIKQGQKTTASSNDLNQKAKSISSYPSIFATIFLTIFWSLVVSIFISLAGLQINNFQRLMQDIFNIQKYMSVYISSSDRVWFQMNQQFPFDQEQVNKSMKQFYEYDIKFHSLVHKLVNFNGFSDFFRQHFTQIWYDNACIYLGRINRECPTILNGAIQKAGIGQIIAYIKRKFQVFVRHKYQKDVFRSLNSVRNIAAIEYGYIYHLKMMHFRLFLIEQQKIQQKFRKSLEINFVTIFLSVFIIGLYKMISCHSDRLEKMELLLTFFDFDDLKHISQFKMYFKSTFHTKQ